MQQLTTSIHILKGMASKRLLDAQAAASFRAMYRNGCAA